MNGEQIKAARQRAGISREKLAAMVGVSLRTIGNWERGVTIPRDRQHRLADLLGMELDQTSPLSGISDLDLIAELTRRLSRANREELMGNAEHPAPTNEPGESPGDVADLRVHRGLRVDAEAARDIGREGKAGIARRKQDEASRPPVDDPQDLEPR